MNLELRTRSANSKHPLEIVRLQSYDERRHIAIQSGALENYFDGHQTHPGTKSPSMPQLG